MTVCRKHRFDNPKNSPRELFVVIVDGFGAFVSSGKKDISRNYVCNLGVQKLTRSGLNGGFGEGLLKDKFAFFEAYESPIPEMRKLLAKCPFLQAKRVLFQNPSELDRVSFSTPE